MNIDLNYIKTLIKEALGEAENTIILEELGFESSPNVVNNNLYYMKQNGVFDKIKGIWVGNYEHESGIALEKILFFTI